MKKIPMRRCVGCMTSKPKNELVRIVAYEGEVTLDPSGKAKGRGVYVCPDGACIARAFKTKALGRSLGQTIAPEVLTRLEEELSGHEQNA